MNCPPSPSRKAPRFRVHPGGSFAVGRITAALARLLLGSALVSCTGGLDTDSQRAKTDLTAIARTDSSLPPCEEGTSQTCSLLLGEHDELLSCYEGVQRCTLGEWSECANGFEFSVTKRQSIRGTSRSLAFSTPEDCTDNPCNRYCREFTEAPSGGIFADDDPSAVAPPQLLVGSVRDYPLATVAIANNDNCQEAADCQLNTRCSDPAVGACGHSVCSEGAALTASCNRCAATVCETDENCCGTSVACTHDPCQEGDSLVATCDSCVEAICADGEHPECCGEAAGDQWTSECVGYVADYCAPLGQTCECPSTGLVLDGICYQPNGLQEDWSTAVTGNATGCLQFGGDWQLAEPKTAEENDLVSALLDAQIDDADPTKWTGVWLGARNVNSVAGNDNRWAWNSNLGDTFFVGDSNGSLQAGHEFAGWAPSRPDAAADGHVLLMRPGGLWSNADPSAELESICSGPPNTLTPASAGIQWDEGCVELARSECGVSCPDTLPLGLGVCTSQVPSRLDGDCGSFDLAVGATCEQGGTPQVPLCNHGQGAAPSGLSIRFFDGSDELGSLEPDLATATNCTLTEAIPPGRCVIVEDCAGISAGDAIVVNLISDSPDPSECRFDDNWSVYEPVTCKAPLCESTIRSAPQVAQLDCSLFIENPLALDVNAAAVTLNTGIPEPGCVDEAVRWGNSCYIFETSSLDWTEARAACTGRGTGWDLISINSASENNFARSGFGAALPNGEFHIGLNDIDEEGTYVWSNGSCTDYVNFSQDEGGITGKGIQPNDDTFGDVQDCIRMFGDNAWGDTSCLVDSSYVCEGPIQDTQGGCAAGQVTGPDGDCYVFDPSPRNWSNASAACNALGAGWGLAHIRTDEVNDFALSLKGCEPTWINTLSDNFSDPAFDQEEILPGSVSFDDDPFIDEQGLWGLSASGDTEFRGSLCQGPSLAVGNPPLEQVSGPAFCTTDKTRQYFFNGDIFGGAGPALFTPESLELCPATCDAAAKEPGSTRLSVDIPCSAPALPKLETLRDDIFYTAECTEGGNQWDFLYYDAVTPGDSRIEFEVRTGRSEEEILSTGAPFTPVASAHAVPTDTQRCEIDPVNGCPIDLFTLLENPGYQREVLQLRVHLIPGSNGEGPLLRDWKVRYSCPPSE